MTLYLGDYRETLADHSWDTAILDTPYSQRTHGGFDSLRGTVETGHKREIGYAYWTPEDVAECVEFAVPRTSDWIVTITDHVLGRDWEDRLSEAGLYVFSPVPWINPLANVRKRGDGSASATCWIIGARPREQRFQGWGSLPGYYVYPGVRGGSVVGEKPLDLVRALVRNYSEPGGVVADFTAGSGTTMDACRLEGRAFIGAEINAVTHAAALAAHEAPYTPDMFGGVA